jgi:spore germination cell wall hydrolase CwlJ-like protein
MSRSRIGWAVSVAAPWCVAFAVLVSITAEAEQEPLDFTSAFAPTQMIGHSGGLDGAILAGRPPRVVDEDGEPLPIVHARYAVGDPGELAAQSDEIEPNGALKQPGRRFPAVDRGAKGDPLIGLPGSKVRRLSGRRSEADPYTLNSWPHELEDPRDDEFDPGHTMSPQRPAEGDEPETAALSFDDGATPAAPLEFALNSSSPTSSDGVLVAVETDGAGQTIVPQLSDAGGKPNYAALIDPKDSARQMRCLAEAIYFESRSEPEEGQAAVAQVVLNRVRSGIYPTTVCGVVYQDRNRPFACQFTFACEGKSLRIEEPGPWAVATRIAEAVVSGANYNPKVGEAVNYHANYVAPFWVGYLTRVDRIGAHIFYAMREGVNWAPGALNGRGDRPPLAN